MQGSLPIEVDLRVKRVVPAQTQGKPIRVGEGGLNRVTRVMRVMRKRDVVNTRRLVGEVVPRVIARGRGSVPGLQQAKY